MKKEIMERMDTMKKKIGSVEDKKRSE